MTSGEVQQDYLVIQYTPTQSKPVMHLYHSCISNYGQEKQLLPSAPVMWAAGDTDFLVRPEYPLAQ